MTTLPTRREFLARAAGAAVLGACGTTPRGAATAEVPLDSAPLFRISLAEWSLHRSIHAGAVDPARFPAVVAREFGCSGAEYVSGFYAGRAGDDPLWSRLRRMAADEGVRNVLVMVDGEGRLADAETRLAAVENHRKWLDAAARLECHSIRVNVHGTGSAGEQARLAADSLVRLADLAAPAGLSILVENHGGLSSNGAWLAGVLRRADHPRVGALPDFGNFTIAPGETYDRYRGVEELMPFAKGVSAKSYAFDEAGDETSIDYRRLLTTVVRAGYRGFIGAEYEGERHSEPEGIRLTKALLERLRGELDPRTA